MVLCSIGGVSRPDNGVVLKYESGCETKVVRKGDGVNGGGCSGSSEGKFHNSLCNVCNAGSCSPDKVSQV